MNSTEKNIEFQIQLWALIGPILALATAVTLLFEGSAFNLHLSWALFIGILLAWRWKVRGLFGALALLALLVGFNYFDIPAEERLWHLGISAAIGLTFFVTALTFDEIESMVGGIQNESTSRLKSLLQLDEKLESVQGRLDKEKNELASRLKEQNGAIESYERLIQVTREEILSTHAQQEIILKELFEKRHEVAKLRESFETSVSSEEQTREVLLQRDQEIENLRLELSKVEEDRALPATAEEHRFKAKYLQLCEQFDAKSRLLDETRKDLFKEKERAAAIEMEQQQRLLERSEMERGLEQCIVQMEEECSRLIQENEELEALVTEVYKQ